jgi:translation initiation factor 1
MSVRVSRETKGRKGKGVTVVKGLELSVDDLRRLARELKQACGSGGTIKQDTIEIQGDHRDRVVEELARRGYAAKRAGG